MTSKNGRRFRNKVLGALRSDNNTGASAMDPSKGCKSESGWRNLSRDELLAAIKDNPPNQDKRDYFSQWTVRPARRPDLPTRSLTLADEYFKSTTDFVIYTLLETDGRISWDNLGIRKIHYCNKRAANEWKLSVQQYLHPNDTAALAKLEKLYLNMVDDYE